MTAVPYFVAQEVQHFDLALSEAINKNWAFLLARCRGVPARPEDIDLFVASYLLMNVMLMGQLNRRILKLISLEEAHRDQRPLLNALRALFHGEFSSLENVELWRTMITKYAEMSAPSLKRIETAIEFISGSGLAEQSAGFRRADIFFTVNGSDEKENGPGLPFRVLDENLFTFQIQSQTKRHSLFAPEFFNAGTNIYVNIGVRHGYFVVDVDLGVKDWLKAWMNNVERIVLSKAYAGQRGL